MVFSTAGDETSEPKVTQLVNIHQDLPVFLSGVFGVFFFIMATLETSDLKKKKSDEESWSEIRLWLLQKKSAAPTHSPVGSGDSTSPILFVATDG